MPACGIDNNAINPGLRGKTSTKTKRISNSTAVRESDIHAEPVQFLPAEGNFPLALFERTFFWLK
jgi:hypothetical protein